MLNAALTQRLAARAAAARLSLLAWGVILAEVTVYTPFTGAPSSPPSPCRPEPDRGRQHLGARPWRIVASVILSRPARPARRRSLRLFLTVNEFGVVLFIGAKGVITLPLLVYDKAIQELDYHAACTIAVVNVALSLALFSLYRFAARAAGRLACWSGRTPADPRLGCSPLC